MDSFKKLLSSLAANLKSLFSFWRQKAKKYLFIYRQKELDKKIVGQLNKKKVPSWRQIKLLPKTLSARENLALKLLAGIILLCLVSLFYIDFYQKLKTSPKDGGEFSEGIVGSPLYINPLFAPASSQADIDLTRLIYSGLLKYDVNLNLVPDLADRFEISADQKTYTVYLKQNVKWQDGQSLNADDVIFTVSSIQDDQYKSALNRSFSNCQAQKIDDYTVKFILKQPYAAFANLLTTGIIPRHLWVNIPAATAKMSALNQKPVGSGPYKLNSLVKEKSGLIKSAVLEKNPLYYGQVPHINKITFKFYADPTSAADALTNKEVQNLASISKQYYDKFDSKIGLNLRSIPQAQYVAVFFNQNNNSLLQNIKVRRALAYAVDREKIINEAASGQGQKIDAPLLPGFLGSGGEIARYEYDPKKALEILTADGWQIDGKILKKKDQELKISLTALDADESAKAAVLLKEFWSAIGITVDLQIISKDRIKTETINPRNFQSLLYGEILGYDSDLYAFWHSSQKSYPGVNLAQYSNRKVDQLLEEARLNNDPQIREEKYREIESILTAELPAIFLYSPNYLYATDSKIKGSGAQKIVNPSDRFVGIENWYIKTKKEF